MCVFVLVCIRAVLCGNITFGLLLLVVFVLESEERKDGGNNDMSAVFRVCMRVFFVCLT